MPGGKEKDVESADNPLWKAILKQAEEIEFGSFVIYIKAHAGEPRELEISDVRKKFRAEAQR